MSESNFALVTGANRGLGLETVRQLARAGVSVVLTARKAADAEAAVAQLSREGLEALALALDVTDPASVEALAAALLERGLGVDVLVNNAAVSLDSFDARVAEETLAVNFYGPVRVTEGLRPRMTEGCRIVNVSSGMGELSVVGSIDRAIKPPWRSRRGVVVGVSMCR